MRNRIKPYLLFFLAVLVPAAVACVYARDAYRKELARLAELPDQARSDAAEQASAELALSIEEARSIVARIPRAGSLAEAVRVASDHVPRHAELVVVGPSDWGQPDGGGLVGVRPAWFKSVLKDDVETPEVIFGAGAGDTVFLRELANGQRVGFAFTEESVLEEALPELERRGLGLVRRSMPIGAVEGIQAVAREVAEAGSAAPKVVARDVLYLNPMVQWDVVIKDADRLAALDRGIAHGTYRGTVGGTLALVLVALVLFVRGQRSARLAELRTDFVAAVSHELRTPLASVRMLAELLEAGAVPADQRPEVDRTLAVESRRLHATLERMLRFGALSRGKLGLDRRVQPITPLLEAAVHRSGAGRAVLAAAPDLVADVDGELLGQAVENLVGNAVKYAPAGPVNVRAGVVGGALLIEVVDQGPGLDRRAQRRIFQPFERADARLTKATDGTGVGLALVRGIARAHGGDATVQSAPGAGATFQLRLPLGSAVASRALVRA